MKKDKWKKDPRATVGDGKTRKTKTVEWPDSDVWCSKCRANGFLPVAVMLSTGPRVLAGVAACDCEWGRARMEQNREKLHSYYSYPADLIVGNAKSWMEIVSHFRELENELWERVYGYREQKRQQEARA